jgi:hypothetical protein
VSYLLGGTTALLVIAVLALVWRALSSKDAQLTDRTEALAQKERAGEAVKQRDAFKERAEKAEAENADTTKQLTAAQEHVADLSAKLARAVIARASQPVSQDGADAVNEQLSEPVLGDGLEKP